MKYAGFSFKPYPSFRAVNFPVRVLNVGQPSFALLGGNTKLIKLKTEPGSLRAFLDRQSSISRRLWDYELLVA